MCQSLHKYDKAGILQKQTEINSNPVPYYAIGSTDWILVYNKQTLYQSRRPRWLPKAWVRGQGARKNQTMRRP